MSVREILSSHYSLYLPQNCLAVPVSTIIWSARKRLCKKCIEADFGKWSEVIAETHLESALIYTLVPSYREFHRGRRGWRRTQEVYSYDVATKLNEECAAFRKGGAIDTTDPAYTEWYERKYNEIKEINAHAELCGTWAANRTTERKDELDDARRLRRESIIERLTALGWGEEIPHHTRDFNSHKLVKQPKELTDRIWKNIEGPLVEFLTVLKKERLAAACVKLIRERRHLAAQVYNKFRETFPPEHPHPPRVEVLLTEPFRVIIEDTPLPPDEEKVTEESFAAALLSVPDFSADWVRRQNKALVQILKKVHPDSVETDLHLATTFFTCSEQLNAEPICYPRILVHSMATNFQYHRDFNTLQGTLGEEAWNHDGKIKFHERAEHNVRSIVEACELDPDVITRAEMDEINPALECLNCSNETGRLLMRWIQAAHHHCGSASVMPSWKCLDVHEDRILEEEEKRVLESSVTPYSYWQEHYCCKFCGDSRKMTVSKLKDHLRTEHNISEISFQHFEYHLDAPLSNRHPRPVRLKPVQEVETKESENKVTVAEAEVDISAP
ncbi:F-box domain-containing protein [Mycena venus]|uniref:F-box domain-containing protein n=1 Tax=Mycena venus TaxID=2733690 RepID=A0A8H6WXR5_9AGAR|nr:F-box domain-containing protein [Mycena venus]